MIKTIDLFAGAGGLTSGFQAVSSRFRTIVAVESDRPAAATYAANNPGAEVINKPIEDWLRRCELPEADVIVGGPPCQGFSALGKQDIDDERNFLWRQYAQVIVAARPKYFVVENVAQFLGSSQFQAFKRLGQRNGRLRDYDLSAHAVLNAAEFGCPQIRRRMVLIGRHKDMPDIGLPEPSLPNRSEWLTVADAWGESGGTSIDSGVSYTDLPDRWLDFGGRPLRGQFKTTELHLTRRYAPISIARIQRIPYGGNRNHIPYSLQSECWRNHKSGAGDVMGRLVWEKPSVTIRTEFVKPEKGRYLHPVENRAITLMEGARLQGFPDDYLWCGSKTDIAKQIGNAVPVPLASAVARHLLSVL